MTTPEQQWLANRPDGPYRVLGTGSQTWNDPVVVRDTLALVWHPSATLVLGACPRGGDRLMEDCWTHWGGQVEPHPADWAGRCQLDCPGGHRRTNRRGEDYCPRAGMVRNLRMVQLGAAVCVSLIRDHSPGASQCTDWARAAGILVIERTAPAATEGAGREATRGARRADSRLDNV